MILGKLSSHSLILINIISEINFFAHEIQVLFNKGASFETSLIHARFTLQQPIT